MHYKNLNPHHNFTCGKTTKTILQLRARSLSLPVAPRWQLFTGLSWERWFTPTAWTVELKLLKKKNREETCSLCYCCLLTLWFGDTCAHTMRIWSLWMGWLPTREHRVSPSPLFMPAAWQNVGCHMMRANNLCSVGGLRQIEKRRTACLRREQQACRMPTPRWGMIQELIWASFLFPQLINLLIVRRLMTNWKGQHRT